MKKQQTGATMVEYAIMVVFIAAVAIATIVTLGGYTAGLFDDASDEMQVSGMTASSDN